MKKLLITCCLLPLIAFVNLSTANTIEASANLNDDETIPGGWTSFRTDISEEAIESFSLAFYGHVGVVYRPIAVSSQVVAGTHYRFFCNTREVYPNAPTYPTMVSIYVPLNGPPHITGIKRLN